MITYVGIAIAFITLVITFRMNQREKKALESKYTPQTVTIERQPDRSTMDTLE